jgi:Flp pilus assembly protein TadB
MAQTKRKRRTKHRGNAAGTIEARGRTGRPLSPEEKKKAQRDKAREDRLTREPTWNQSFKRALMAAGLMFVFLLITDHTKKGSPLITAVIFAIIALVIYVPAGYYMERFLWRRRMEKMGRPVTRQVKR